MTTHVSPSNPGPAAGQESTRTIIRRRPTPHPVLALAAVLIVVVGMSLALLLQGSSDDEGGRYAGGPRAVLFLERDANDEQLAALEEALAQHPDVEEFEYWDSTASRAEFRRLFERCESMLRWLERNPEQVPTSFRVVPVDNDPEVAAVLATDFLGESGVYETTHGPGDLDQAGSEPCPEIDEG
jgi:cell division protein FtsX